MPEDGSKTFAISLAPRALAQGSASGCTTEANSSDAETNGSDAVETAVDELISAPAGALGGNYSAAATAPSAHGEGLEQGKSVQCISDRYDGDVCHALRIQFIVWDHVVRNDVQQMWAVASAKQREMVVGKFAAAFVVYLGALGVQLDVEGVQRFLCSWAASGLRGFLQSECAGGGRPFPFGFRSWPETLRQSHLKICMALPVK